MSRLVCMLGVMAAPGAALGSPLTAPEAGRVITISGPVAPEALGPTLVHEHLIADFNLPDERVETWNRSGRTRPTAATAVQLYEEPLTIEQVGAVTMGAPNRDNMRLRDEALAIAEARDFKAHGGGAIVDATSLGLGRDPAMLRRIAKATGLHVVMGTGWYRRPWAGTDVAARDAESLAAEMIADIRQGVDGVRAGLIGELAATDPADRFDRAMLQAAARASRATGAAISLDMAADQPRRMAVLDLLAAEGADLSRVALGHANPLAADMPALEALLARGIHIQFDLLGDIPTVRTIVSDHEVALAIIALVQKGFGDRILISQDVSARVDLKAYGGSGYGFIAEQFAPYLEKLGLDKAAIAKLTTSNPQRFLALASAEAR